MKLSIDSHNKITKSKDYLSLHSQCDIYKGTLLYILARKNTLDTPRMGLAIAKNKLKLAVDRNLCKRIVRESFRTNQHQLQNYDFIVKLYKKMGFVNKHSLRADLEKLWSNFLK